MADQNTSLPIRTESNGDAAVKVVDGTLNTRLLTVNADGSVNITDNGSSITVDAVNLDIRDLVFASDKVDASGSTVALDAPTLAALESITVQNGAGGSAVNIQDGGNTITVDGTVELGATTLAALESITVQNGAGASAVNIQDGGNSLTVDATDLDIRDLNAATDSIKSQLADGSGTYYSATNPIPVAVSNNNIGSEVNNYSTNASVAASGTSNHDYTVTAAKTLLLSKVWVTGSGKIKAEVQIETAAASGVFNTVFVGFNSTANPLINIEVSNPISVVAGARVRVIRTNRDNQAQDVYSTISGQEVP
jgi:hypothetical protein